VPDLSSLICIAIRRAKRIHQVGGTYALYKQQFDETPPLLCKFLVSNECCEAVADVPVPAKYNIVPRSLVIITRIKRETRAANVNHLNSH